jgi:hypothetical protein
MKDKAQMMASLEIAAQDAAEYRLEYAHATLMDEDELDRDLEEYGEELAGPFCGCLTCEVRETLDAAYPFLKKLALLEVATDGRFQESFDEVDVDVRELI